MFLQVYICIEVFCLGPIENKVNIGPGTGLVPSD